jgi:hypothetical protein
MHVRARCFPALLLVATFPLLVPSAQAQKKKAAPASVPTTSSDPDAGPWSEAQPPVEKLDLTMYQKIREEGLQRSRIMDYASALTDDIGPRLTGSPNMARANAWTRDQLTAMGCVNAHLDDWGEFGMGWQQLNTWVRMTAPDTAVFIAQATPWSPATSGPINAEVTYVNIQTDEDFAKYQGRLAGKIVLLGEMRPVPPVDAALFERYSDKDLAEMASFPVEDRASAAMQQRLRMFMQRMKLTDKLIQFLGDEKVAAVIRPSRDAEHGGGSGGTIFDDNGAAMGRTPYIRGHEMKVPTVVMAIESYGRVYRLLEAHVPVKIEMDVETKFTGDHEHGYDTIAEIRN